MWPKTIFLYPLVSEDTQVSNDENTDVILGFHSGTLTIYTQWVSLMKPTRVHIGPHLTELYIPPESRTPPSGNAMDDSFL